MKKIISFVFLCLCALSVVFATGCEKEDKVVVGLICLHDTSSTYDNNFIESMYRAFDELGLDAKTQLKLYTGVPEGNECFEKADQLASICDVIFADSFGHEDHMIKAAKLHPDVNFCHATGEKAHLENLDNYSNAFADIYQGRYLAGIAAGMKLNEMNAGKAAEKQNWKMGYVGAFPYAEVVSGYTSFFLGAKSVLGENADKLTMEVRYTSSWYDYSKEQAAANALIAGGCALISQHADSYGAPEACEANGVPNVTYNGTTVSKCPNTYVISSKIDWTPYFKYMIECTINGTKIKTDWCGGLENGSVKLDAVGTCAAAGTQEAIDAAKAKLISGEIEVFDTANWTVGGQHLTTVMANVDFDSAYTPDHEALATNSKYGFTYFDESELRSAPYWEVRIDGITEINEETK